jgi:hypothetical protein
MPKIQKKSKIIVNLPGIDSSQLKDLEPAVAGNYGLSLSWSLLAVTSVILAQISYNTNPKIKHYEYMTSESISLYVKKVLANTTWSRTIYGLLAIRKTMGYYDLKNDSEKEQGRLSNDYADLVENPTGLAATKGGIRTALISPERTRKYRRGLMLSASGSLCNKPLSSPTTVISREDASSVTLLDILKLTPFAQIVSVDEIRMAFNGIMPLDNNGEIRLVDNFKLTTPNNITSIEAELDLNINRESLEISLPELAVDKDNLDDFQKLIWNAKKNLS